MQFFGMSDVGCLREKNEDNFIQGIKTGDLVITGVADGMGGHHGGDVASEIAVSSVRKHFHEQLESEYDNHQKSQEILPKIVKESVEKANQEILDYKYQKNEFLYMGTTMTVGAFTRETGTIAHVGDSRAYIINDAVQIMQLTEDHSYVNQLFQQGKISSEKVANHPQKNILTRALGTGPEINVDIQTLAFPPNSLVMFCTDGLTDQIQDDEIYQMVVQSKNIESACKRLVQEAKERGGHDNITVTMITNSELAGIFKR
ncbi:Stp1/IreP family PP2C-type Ser/Thr phosphatase [Natranaerobius thermophilus]|uniref:Protein serine/threonine phosphatase n=1 Tax=Natranaerobius thermophilus (strain ATCC BAA-1301 / DSM 18059 / JW/NM-WN-LF) TaxID=457570 RepID=B2A2K7_NATTJ|nr:Stp1/IreP family PP2C-type Ser/Thr phosphatase [Natranaerobius thermophilus]ACB84922.1 protein serine/threonine phosphatase [Natranaerobius thermophilus JW/NM-WN-LF]